MKALCRIIAAVMPILLLSGCVGPNYYTQEDKSKIARKGESVIKSVLPEGAELKPVSAYESILLGGPWRLTDYAYGEYTLNGKDITFFVNSVTEEIYTSENFSALEEAAADLPLRALGLDRKTAQCEIEDISLILPNDLEELPVSGAFIEKVLPLGTENIDAFIESAERPLISVKCGVTVPDSVDITEYSLEKIRSLGEAHGIYFSSLKIENESGYDTLNVWGNSNAEFIRKGMTDFGDHLFYGIISQREERYSGGKISSDVYNYYPEKDIIREKTENGYRFSFSDELKKTKFRPEFILLARDGSEMLGHDYELHYDDADHTTECFWKRREDGLWVLTASYGEYKFEKNVTEMTERS